jgi:signal transduction histidine kinase
MGGILDTVIDILLVDDEPLNLSALEVILANPGYRLWRALDADSALRILLAHEIAAVVLDVRMPMVSGFELARIIKSSKKYQQVPIIFLTAHLFDDQDIIAGYGAGAADYLSKPVNPEILRYKVAVYAELFRKTRALAEANDRLADLNANLAQRVEDRTAELKTSETALRAANQQKDEFLAILSHELRNPLAPLRTGLDTLLHMEGQPAGAGRTLTIMDRQVDYMVRLIDELLDLSQIGKGEMELRKDRVELGALLGVLADGFRGTCEQRGQLLKFSSPLPVFASVDGVRISQCISNLLHNASKLTPAGGSIRLELTQGDEHAMIRVADTGAGIPASELERIFDMFAHIKRSEPQSKRGLGIGLALAKRIAALHDGQLSAASEGEGLGSTFTLTLPAIAMAQTSTAPARG